MNAAAADGATALSLAPKDPRVAELFQKLTKFALGS
jgi:hypothetical protein